MKFNTQIGAVTEDLDFRLQPVREHRGSPAPTRSVTLLPIMVGIHPRQAVSPSSNEVVVGWLGVKRPGVSVNT